MNIQPDPTFRGVVLKKIEAREFSERKGIHQSDLNYCLNKQALRRMRPIATSDADLLLYSLGWATQRWLTGQDKDVPEEEQDGIIVTLDSTYDSAPWELKATFQSSAKPIEENVPWLRQLMAQCFVTGTKSAKLTRLEIMGNWKSVFGKKDEKGLEENRKPTLSAWSIDFTVDELARNWEWLIDRRDKFLSILASGKLLPRVVALPSGQDWECERCPYEGNLCKE